VRGYLSQEQERRLQNLKNLPCQEAAIIGRLGERKLGIASREQRTARHIANFLMDLDHQAEGNSAG
jgi:hypothetical protein